MLALALFVVGIIGIGAGATMTRVSLSSRERLLDGREEILAFRETFADEVLRAERVRPAALGARHAQIGRHRAMPAVPRQVNPDAPTRPEYAPGRPPSLRHANLWEAEAILVTAKAQRVQEQRSFAAFMYEMTDRRFWQGRAQVPA